MSGPTQTCKAREKLGKAPALALNASQNEGQTLLAAEAAPSILDRFHALVIGSAILRWVMYIVGFGIMFAFVFGSFEFYKPGNTMSQAAKYAHSVSRRPGFVLGLMIMMYPAFLGKARVMRAILGAHVFNVLSKVVYSAYMDRHRRLRAHLYRRNSHYSRLRVSHHRPLQRVPAA